MNTARFRSIVVAILAACAFAALGVYVLHKFNTTAGLIIGASSVAIALGIAFPTPFHDGAVVAKGAAVLLIPVIVGALKGGSRRDDPPADPPSSSGGAP